MAGTWAPAEPSTASPGPSGGHTPQRLRLEIRAARQCHTPRDPRPDVPERQVLIDGPWKVERRHRGRARRRAGDREDLRRPGAREARRGHAGAGGGARRRAGAGATPPTCGGLYTSYEVGMRAKTPTSRMITC